MTSIFSKTSKKKGKKVLHLCTPPNDFTPKCGGFGHVTTLLQRVTCADCKKVSPKQLIMPLFVALFVFFFIPSVTHAANFNEDFESFTTGSIAGQGNFSIYATGTTQNVATDQFHGGAKSLKMRASGGSQSHVLYTSTPFAGKTGVTFWVRKSSNTSFSRMCGWDTATASCYGQVEFSNGGQIRVTDSSGGANNIQAYNANQWYKIDFDYDAVLEKTRVRVDGGSWSSWYTAFGSSSLNFADMDGFKFMQIGTADDLWIDDMAPYPLTLPDAFTYPTDGQMVKAGTVTFTGTCSNPGTHYSMNWRDFNWLSSPNITCSAEGTWSHDYPVTESGGGGKPYYLYNHVTDTSVNIGVIGYLSENFDWLLSVNYPVVDSSGMAKVQENPNFPIRVYYTIPDGIPDTLYQLVRYTDNTYSTIAETVDSAAVSALDSAGLGYIDSHDATTSGVTNYYRAYIGDGDTVSFSVTFRLVGSSDTDSQPALFPEDTDIGPIGNTIRTLFIPKPGQLKETLMPATTMLDQKLAFFYDIGSIITTNLSGFSTENPSIDFTSPVGTSSSASLIDFAAPFMITVSTYIRTTIDVLLWVGGALWAFLYAKRLVET